MTSDARVGRAGRLDDGRAAWADTRSVNDEAARESEDPDGPRDGSTPADADPTVVADPPAVDIDLQFASIIAHWEDEPVTTETDTIEPDTIETVTIETVITETVTTQPSAPSTPPKTHDDEDESLFGWRGYAPPPDIDDHFEPPPPDLPPAHDATYWLAVAGLTLGPVLIMWAAVFSNNPDPGWWVLFGIALTVAGFGLMVLRGSGERDPDDNGARL